MAVQINRFFIIFLFIRTQKLTFAKLPPTRPPCTQMDIEAAQHCRDQIGSKLPKDLPRKAESFLMGLFFGKMLVICNKAESYAQCTKFLTDKNCRFSYSNLREDSTVLSVLSMCRHRYLYESYHSLVACVKSNKVEFSTCYEKHKAQVIIKQRGVTQFLSRCSALNDLDNCVNKKVINYCERQISTDLASLLVRAGIPYSYNCSVARQANSKNVEEPQRIIGGNISSNVNPTLSMALLIALTTILMRFTQFLFS